ncbi:MAG: acetate--CoA ligase alpha subunit [Desulfurococcaceae archaeon]
MHMSDQLAALFRPRSVAVIGASREPNKIGHIILKNLKEYGYKGRIYPINPNATEIEGLKAYPSVLDVPDEIDVAIVAIPEKLVLEAAEQCGRKGVKHLVVITSGFGEVGNVEAERKLVEIARKYGMRVLGPNIFGYVYTPFKLNATFGPLEVKEGPIAFLSQSGALGIALMGWTIMEEIGLSALVSLGNMADVDVLELAEYLADDPETKVITVYLEGLKPGSGRRFVEVMSKVTKRKPVIVIKAGISQRGAAAVASHTGSLAGNAQVYAAAFKQAGVIQANTVEEMFDWARAFAYLPLPKGESTLIVTNGGGVGVLATDAAEKHGVPLLMPSEELKERLRKAMPWFGSPKNPVDLTGQAVVENYISALETALEASEVDNIVVLYCRTAVLDPRDLANAIVGLAKKRGLSKPVLVAMVGGEDVAQAIRMLNRHGIPAYPSPERAVTSLAKVLEYRRYLAKSGAAT